MLFRSPDTGACPHAHARAPCSPTRATSRRVPKHEGAIDGHPLGLVGGDRIAVGQVAVGQVPARQLDPPAGGRCHLEAAVAAAGPAPSPRMPVLDPRAAGRCAAPSPGRRRPPRRRAAPGPRRGPRRPPPQRPRPRATGPRPRRGVAQIMSASSPARVAGQPVGHQRPLGGLGVLGHVDAPVVEVGLDRLLRPAFADRQQGLALPARAPGAGSRPARARPGSGPAPGRLPRRRSPAAGRRLPPAPAWPRPRSAWRASSARSRVPTMPASSSTTTLMAVKRRALQDRARRSAGAPACARGSPSLPRAPEAARADSAAPITW